MRFAKYQGIGNDFVMLADPDDDLEPDARDGARACATGASASGATA